MTLPPELIEHIKLLFAPLNNPAAAKHLPEISTLSSRLEAHLGKASAAGSVNLAPSELGLFATASVEMWQRAVHSYLISAALTKDSPVWSSVSGYYSSHYSVRAIAHLLGCFQLYTKGKIARLSITPKKNVCVFDPKKASDREHKIYWKLVKESPVFQSDPLFTINSSDTDRSDVGHRDRANYADHVGKFPTFKPLEEEALKQRTSQIAQMTFDVPPIPCRRRFPDVNSVQIVAYQRLVKYRTVLDSALSTTNRFWTNNRKPNWAGILTFQIAEQRGISSITGN